MSGRFVRASKYRHVFGRATKKEQCYDNLRISKNAWDTNLIKVNPKYISVNWEASGGGAFAVIPENERGKLPERLPLFRGHTAAVLDTDWSPFDDSLIASASDDGKVYIWRVPEGFTLHTDGDEVQDVSPVSKLTGHSRKVGHVLFNPSAANVLASSSGDYTIKLWDIEQGTSKLQLKHGDVVQSLSWSANGSLLVTTCRDKKLRVWDVRQERPAQEVAGHSGAKNSRAVWMGEHDRVATTGFSRMSDRQLGLWDIREPREPIGGFHILDSISGVCMPFWDDGTQCLYLAGKGDGNIRYFEYENDKFEYLSEYKSADPQRGVAFVPKRGVNIHEHEVMRAYKTVNDTYIEPISFIVPRKAEVFQSDIYPPTVGLKPAMSSKEWFDGQESMPPKISLESLYEGGEPVEVAPGQTGEIPSKAPTSSTPTQVATPTKIEPEPSKPEPAPVPVQRGPPPSMKDSKSSIAKIASNFKDEDEPGSSDDETSSFEEIPQPVKRPVSLAARMDEKTKGPQISQAPAQSDSSTTDLANQSDTAAAQPKMSSSVVSRMEEKTKGPQISQAPAQIDSSTTDPAHQSDFAPAQPKISSSLVSRIEEKTSGPAIAQAPPHSEPTSTPADEQRGAPSAAPEARQGPSSSATRSTSTGTPTASGAAEGLRTYLQDIKSLLEQQNKVMASQSQKIEHLTAELDTLKTRLVDGSGGGEKDERIRQLELELEEARS